MRLIEEYLESNQRICYLSDIISYNSACCNFEIRLWIARYNEVLIAEMYSTLPKEPVMAVVLMKSVAGVNP